MNNDDKRPRINRSASTVVKSSVGPRHAGSTVHDVRLGLSRSSSGMVLFYASPMSEANLTLPVFVSGVV